jgi:hypothetical protein
MSREDTLDLAQVDPPVWRIMVGDVAYGPYTLGQMRSFLGEERLNIHSRVADGDGGAFMPAGEQPGLQSIFREHLTPQVNAEAEATNQVVIVRHVEGSRSAMIGVLNELGTFGEVMPGVYLINTTATTKALRDSLTAVSEDGDRILVVNAANGRLGWQGLGPEADTHIRAIWDR